MDAPRSTLPAGAAIAAALFTVIAGLIMLGTPSHARERRLDDLRVQDLSGIANAIDLYWTKHAALPDTVDSLVSAHLLDRVPTDPSSGVRYPIYLTGGHSYRLCATFAQPLDTMERRTSNDYGNLYRGTHSWRHDKGKSCFDLTAQRPDTMIRHSGDVVFEVAPKH